MIIIICPRCSTNNPIGSNNCGRCGTPLGDYTLSEDYIRNHRQSGKNSNGPLIAVIVALLILLLVIVGVMLYIFLKSSPKTNTPPDSASSMNQTVSNIATNAARTVGRTTGNNLANAGNKSNIPASGNINIPLPVSAPVGIPYSNPSNAMQRYMNKAAEIENYEYNTLYNVSNQTDKNLHSRVTYEKWDVLLNEVYTYLKNNMSRSDFKALDADEMNWIKRKESAISSAVAQYKGTSREPEARYMTGISHTKDRCYYLISLVQSSTPAPPPPSNTAPDVQQQYLNKASQIEGYEDNIYNATNQTDKNLHARIAFEKWDVLLNEVYTYLKNNMSGSDFKALDNDELSWIKRKETAISNAVAEHKGQSTENEARYTTGIQYTKERCYYLISLINQ